ncbi:hypothetical protein [Streptomyces sp. NPDC056669]|uniref:hypothetical protein n=1 Tax=Streptomyces sp. NPDC056669 TaxID=3345903 RepID=UPI0036C8FDCB
MTTILYLFSLQPDVDADDYEKWAHSVDLPTLNALNSVRRYRILRAKQSDGKSVRKVAEWTYMEIIEVDSVQDFQREMEAPGLRQVAAKFDRFASTPTVLSFEDLTLRLPDLDDIDEQSRDHS